jgi:hypothetical protein
MEQLITPQNIMFVLGIFGVVFGVYHYLTKPQIQLDKQQALNKQAVDSKDTALIQQIQWEKESNAKRFNDLQIEIKEAMTLAQNHIHSIDLKVDRVSETVNSMGQEITRLGTIIEERIPRK